ncbi:DegT/DnrJ/EryC1/StrS aminotransferase family protein, partial [Actinomadura logoneensis]
MSQHTAQGNGRNGTDAADGTDAANGSGTGNGSGGKVPFAVPSFADGVAERVTETLTSGWVTTGPQVAEFERDFAAYLGADTVVAVASCTAALELCLRALDLPPGSPVLTPSLTFCGAVNAILHAGLRPVLVDVDEDTLVPSERTVAEAAARTRPLAMVTQNQAGYPVDVPALAAAAGLDRTRVVEDAAHGPGAARGGVRVGA